MRASESHFQGLTVHARMTGSFSPHLADISLLVVEASQGSGDSSVTGMLNKGGFQRVLASKTTRTAKRIAQSTAVQVALISTEIPEGKEEAYDLVDFLATKPKPVRSLLIAHEWNRRDVIEAFIHGAKGLLTEEPADFQRLCKAVACVYIGQVWANSEQLNHTLDHLAARTRNGGGVSHSESLLSKRQRQVAQLLAKGASNKEIARALHICERTVKNHIGNIFEKIGVSSRVQAAIRLTR
jgi:DNA-binding NarL/FixJ family response regulator